MKCLNCGVFTLLCFCHHCAEELSEFSLGVRELEKD
ncbi:ComF family protein, partial [Campylobacter coli]|nr:ComF family protein [Campylobacter coli]EAH9646618.1 ComF family protein [Campylobacter coli]EAI0685515.1 ComF family protein [Campylobacter coli]EAI3352955.1 ComF family protein [Campylobacter coli]EAI9642776.1 ComF family protein [Campylobacter coli]